MSRAETRNLVKTAQRIDRLEQELTQARAQLRRDVERAHESGESVSEIARHLEVTRTRIYQLLESSKS